MHVTIRRAGHRLFVNTREAQQPHYLRGGTPGAIRLTPGTAPWHASGYDPMGKYDAETRQKKRNMELANGRLAMLGMAAFVAAGVESKQ